MNIMIASAEIYSAALKALVKKEWPSATVHQVDCYEKMFECIFERKFNLLILELSTVENVDLAGFISKASNYSKIVILYDSIQHKLSEFGLCNVDAFLKKSASINDVVSTLCLLM